MFGTGGLKLWINAEGKKDRSFGIKYVGPFDTDMISSDDQGRTPEKMEQILDRMQNIKRGMTLIVKGLEILPERGRVPEVAFNSSYGNNCLEYRVPLQKNSDEPYSVDISSAENILLGFEMSPLKGLNGTKTRINPETGMTGRGRAGSKGSGGGRGMGGGKGGMSGGQTGGQKQTTNMGKQEVWVKLTLANQSGK